MKAIPLPSLELVNECLEYDYHTGIIYWKARPVDHFGRIRDQRTWNARFAGKPAGRPMNERGYIQIRINGVSYLAHRIAWLMTGGVDPGDLFVDHVDRNTRNNRPENIRLATREDNVRNSPSRSTSRLGVKCVSPSANGERFMAQTSIKGVGTKYLGTFDTIEEASEAYFRYAKEVYGEFARKE